MDLHTIWFLLLGTLLAGYAILDGFDLGVGILHLFAHTDQERRNFLNAIGPIWDGNEVWLITFGGALFAAFPEAYATIFSGFYIPFMILLFALIFRAVSIEFRSKLHSPGWRATWDYSFFISSLIATFLFGVAVGNAMKGIPLNERGVFTGNFLDLLSPYPLMVGLLAVGMFAMHGALYLHLKAPRGELHDCIHRKWLWRTWGTFLNLYIIVTIFTLTTIPRAVSNFNQEPWITAVMISSITLSILAIVNIPIALHRENPGQAFLSSCIAIGSLVALFGMALWPNLITASNNPAYSLTVHHAASSPKTLAIMLIIAGIGMPLVLAYTGIVHWIFFREPLRVSDPSKKQQEFRS